LLIERYIDRNGPVTLDDVAWWTGLGMRRCRDALHELDTPISRYACQSGTTSTGLAAPTSTGSCMRSDRNERKCHCWPSLIRTPWAIGGGTACSTLTVRTLSTTAAETRPVLRW
jgi:hypothetical protein